MKKIKFLFNNLDVVILSLISIAFFSLIIFDVNSWYYSAIGDEYTFFNFSRDIALGNIHLSLFPEIGKISIFSQKGVYDVVPVASSAFQSLVMKVFGISHHGWVTSSIVIVILSLWSFYFLIKDCFGRTTAIVSSLIFISSHYLWAFTHLGYWNIQVFFPPLAAFFFFFRGIKTKKVLLLFLAGIFSGLGFYTYFSARLTILLLSLFLLWNFKQFIQHKKLIAAFFIGFIILIIPYFLINKETVISQMFERSAVGSTEIPNNERFVYFLRNLYSSFAAFYYNTKTSHFVSGSLVDSVTVIFFSLGLIKMILSWRKFYFVIICLTSSLVIVGGFSPYIDTTITRLLFLLPIIALISAFGLLRFITLLSNKIRVIPLSIYKFLPIIIILTIFILNTNNFYYETPLKMDLTPEALVIKAISSFAPCNSNTIVVFHFFEPLLKPALSSYNMSQSISLIHTLTKSDRQYVEDKSCIIFVEPKEATSLQAIQEFAINSKFLRKEFSSPSGNRNIVVFFKPLTLKKTE